ncbi:uncharacterized protein Dwil_GK24507 [Drosophila willistoni]|uniref:Glycerol-3-phosphate dehydrogenase n=1 Tax=Drosophila willistoni TaxID=7260 RepID=B4N0B6_DROWI|nr:glycerol-3-phosphate dehydrogenase, mitochondrial [Drosophila willistoni]EDW77529.2 uncharacterized protein Dwil_GK24507 [Drosophila willistoni]
MLSKLYCNLARCGSCRSSEACHLLRTATGLQLHQAHGVSMQKKVPTREEHLHALKQEDFDLLIIGGGAAGCGCAVDAACRGLKTALIEADDFSSGASSKSSKLIDGAGSYLSAAIREKNFDQLYLMQQVMEERATMFKIAPHLNRVQPMLMPIYNALQMPIYWFCLKVYDWVAGMSNVRGSHFVSKEATLFEFPLLKEDGLRGGLVYYDGQLDDARMCIALIMTAVELGANVANHMELTELIRKDGCCRCAGVKDILTGETFFIQAKAVINCTGAHTDTVRLMDDNTQLPISVPTLGTHLSLPKYFGSNQYGLLSPSTEKDEPSLIMVPFENRVILGTTDGEVEDLCKSPAPTPEDVEELLDMAREHFDECVQLGSGHVLSAWTGMRTNVLCPAQSRAMRGPCSPPEDAPEQQPVSSYLLEISDCRLITLGGGRWSTYRVMAEEAVDAAIDYCDLDREAPPSCTKDLMLDGAEGWCCMTPLNFVQAYDVPMDVAQHISDSYGHNGHVLLSEATPALKKRLHPLFPYIEAEVQYAARHEYACTLVDIIARRLRIAFVDAVAALQMLPRVLAIMSKHHNWDEEEQKKQLIMAQKFLVRQMGLGSIVKPKPKPKGTKKASSGSSDPSGGSPQKMEVRSYSGGQTSAAADASPPKQATFQHPAYHQQSQQHHKCHFAKNLVNQRLVLYQNTTPLSMPAVLPMTSGITSPVVAESAASSPGMVPATTSQQGPPKNNDLATDSFWRNKFMC